MTHSEFSDSLIGKPAVARALLPGDLVIDLTEDWKRDSFLGLVIRVQPHGWNTTDFVTVLWPPGAHARRIVLHAAEDLDRVS